MLRLVAVLLMLVSVLVENNAVTAENTPIECKSKGDLVFIVDKSASIELSNWQFQITGLKAIVDNYVVGPDDWKFGAVTFQGSARRWFDLDTHTESVSMKRALDNIDYDGTGITNIAAGFIEAEKIFREDGNRADVQDIAILFSDGEANKDARDIYMSLKNLKDDGVLVLTVGIGPAITDKLAKDLTGWASHPTWYFTSDTYEGLADVIHSISVSVCDVSTDCTDASVGCDTCTADLDCIGCDAGYYLDGIDCEECRMPNCAECSHSTGCDKCANTNCGENTIFNHTSCTCVRRPRILTDPPSTEPPSTEPPSTKPCYHCTYNAYGQGFVADSSDITCCMYYECWRTEGATDSTETLRNCPRGTWFNANEGGNGNPCTNSKPNDQCADFCSAPNSTFSDSGCMLYPNGNDHAEFGTCSAPSDNTCPGSASFNKAGECIAGQTFDHPSCTCVGSLSPRNCVAAINLQNDIQDHSTMKGHIVASGSHVTFVNAIVPLGAAGFFSGQAGLTKLNNAAMGGAFGGCSTKLLSAGVFFNAYDISDAGVFRGIISYGKCDDEEEPSFGIYQQGNKIIAKAGGLSATSNQDIVAHQWYYAAFTFQRRIGDLKLYLMSQYRWISCRNDCNTCPSFDKRVTANTMTCIESRPCGMDVGWTGTSDHAQGFFNGAIAQAQVYRGRNVNACHLPRCF